MIVLMIALGHCANSQGIMQKLALYVGTGLVIIPGNENMTKYFVPQNAFGSFKPGISLNFCLLYLKNRHLSYGLEGQYFFSSKQNHRLYNTSAGPILKFNFISTYEAVSPFVIAGPKFGYTYINRAEYRVSEKPNLANDTKQVDIQNLNLQFGYAQFGIPSFGLMGGAGVDFRLTKRLKLFLMGTYTYEFTKGNKLLKENYPQQQTNLGFITTTVGINYKLKKETKAKKNINNLQAHDAEKRRQQTMKKISNAAAKKYVTQKMPPASAPVPKTTMKFKTLSKEELDPNKKYVVDGQVTGDSKNFDDASVLILDEKGKIVGSSKIDKNGRFAYKGLKPDNYSLALSKSDPNMQAKANVVAEDPSMKVDAADLNKFHYNRLAAAGKTVGVILGDAKLGDNGQVASDQTLLLLDAVGNIAATTKTNKLGKYAFRNLKTDDYQVLAADNPAVKASVMAAGGDPNMKIDEAAFKQFPFKKLANGQKPEGVVIGNITSANGKEMNDQSVLLLDDNGNVVAETKTNKLGKFAFKGLQPDGYQAVLAGGDPNVFAKAGLGMTDPSMQMPENAFFKFGKLGNAGAPEKFITGKVDLAANSQNATDATVLLLDDKGNVVESIKLNSDGTFVMKNVRSASYQVVVEGADYDKMVFDVGKNDAANSSISANVFNKYAFNKLNADGTPQNLVIGKIDMAGQTLPAEGVNVMLIDENGTAIERAVADKDGNFAFKDVKAGNYQAVVEGQDYKKVTMDVANSDNAAKISATDFFKHSYDKLHPDDANKMVIGNINSSAEGKSAADQTVLLLDNDGNIIHKTVVTKDGSFTFNNLKADNYQMVLEKPDPAFKTNLSAIVKDPDMKVSTHGVMKYNFQTKTMEKLTEHDKVIITGTIRSEDFMAVENRTVMLLDDQGNIVRQVFSDRHGVFKFQGINAKDYHVAYQDGDKKVNPVVQMYKDNDPAVTEVGGKIAKTLYYDHNQTTVSEKDKTELEKFVKFYKEHPNTKIIKLNAYGDATGTDEANMEVTQKRAKMVMEYLEKRGIPKDKLKLNPLGKSLKFKNKYSLPDPKLNRKVDIEIVE